MIEQATTTLSRDIKDGDTPEATKARTGHSVRMAPGSSIKVRMPCASAP